MRTASVAGAGCGLWFLVVAVFNITVGAITFSYDIWVLFDKKPPILADIICGLILGEATTPIAIVLWILSVFGVHFAH